MAAIDIGPGATDRDTNWSPDYTAVNLNNPANDTGALTVFELWFDVAGTGVKVGTFYGSGTDYTSRDVEVIGNVVAGSKQTFTGLNCSVSSGDFAGTYYAAGNVDLSSTGGLGVYYKAGDQFGTGIQTYTLNANTAQSVYGTGATPGWANISKLCGVASAAIAKVNGVAVASIAKVNGVAV